MTEHRPFDIECLRFEVALQQRIDRFVVLETARRALCHYTADPCDCKYGASFPARPATEASGCPELRDFIFKLTGWKPFVKHPDRAPEELAEVYAEWAREEWLRYYSDEVEAAFK